MLPPSRRLPLSPQFSKIRKLATSTQPTTSNAGDISSVFPSLSGKKPTPLPSKFADLKRSIIAGREAELQASWDRLISALQKKIDEIKRKGSEIIPIVDFSTVKDTPPSPSTLSAIKSVGAVLLRNVIPHQTAEDYRSSMKSYISANSSYPGRIRAFPASSPSVYELYWTPAQVAARAHPTLLSAQKFLQGLWSSFDPSTEISTKHVLPYADRLRIRPPGDAKFALGAHVDGGSLERWEDSSYRSVYSSIFSGNWEAFDPYDSRHRVNANMDLYGSKGGCAMFRMWQGWLSLSSTGPGEGTLKVFPALKEATAYFLLKPFFDANGKLKSAAAMDAEFQGATMGASQELNEILHPELRLEDTMVSIPHVEPGDYVAWHCDTIHAVDREHHGKNESSVFYIPATPLCEINVKYFKKQREAAKRCLVPPDFPGAGELGEGEFEGRVRWEDVDKSVRRGMGMEERFEIENGTTFGERIAVQRANVELFDSN